VSQHWYGKDSIHLCSIEGEEVRVSLGRYVTAQQPLIKVRRYCGELWIAQSAAGINMAHTKRQAMQDARRLIDLQIKRS